MRTLITILLAGCAQTYLPVIEGVQYATGQVVLHWLTPAPRGSIAIFESLEDFKRVHVNPHPTNKTIITWSDGRQEEF